jgi:hypothetical protein
VFVSTDLPYGVGRPACAVHVTQGDLFSDVGASLGGLVQQAQQGAQQLGDALRAGKIVSPAPCIRSSVE